MHVGHVDFGHFQQVEIGIDHQYAFTARLQRGVKLHQTAEVDLLIAVTFLTNRKVKGHYACFRRQYPKGGFRLIADDDDFAHPGGVAFREGGRE